MRGNRVLSGAHGTLHWDGELIFEVKSVNADINFNREDVAFGLDMDSKMTAVSGSGEFVVSHVYSRGIKKLLDAIKKGEDPRASLSVAIKDPDAVGKQIERVNIANVWFNKMTLANFTRGEYIEKTFEFGFTPSDSDLAEGIY
ncbi:MAG: phage tail tube protein [Peptostreptococcaceae bacterium]|nr:phage tail tube protein [Peptostreptococcaceae bacterium]